MPSCCLPPGADPYRSARRLLIAAIAVFAALALFVTLQPARSAAESEGSAAATATAESAADNSAAASANDNASSYNAAASLLRQPAAARHVIHISVDGLNPTHLQTAMEAGRVPTFARLAREGASTLDARTDYTHTNTLPNHTSMLTSRPVRQPKGFDEPVYHGWTENGLPRRRATIHRSNPDVDYIASVFDVAHDADLTTAMFASKDKFVIYDQSYDENSGAPHEHGRDKIDIFVYQDDGGPTYSAGMNERFLTEMAGEPFAYVFVHYRDTDSVGHADGWGGSAWQQTLRIVDGYLADVLRMVENHPTLAGNTTIIVTSDHGGVGEGHSKAEQAENYTIPVFVWGAGVTPGDLYAINADSRRAPAGRRPNYADPRQPIRNGDTGNLALALLGLPPIPGSIINAGQDLRVSLPGDYNLDGSVDAADYTLWRDAVASGDLRADGNGDGRVDQQDQAIWKAHFGRSTRRPVGARAPADGEDGAAPASAATSADGE